MSGLKFPNVYAQKCLSFCSQTEASPWMGLELMSMGTSVPKTPDMPPILSRGPPLVQKIDRRATLITGEPRESISIFQELSLALKGVNAVAFLNTFDSD